MKIFEGFGAFLEKAQRESINEANNINSDDILNQYNDVKKLSNNYKNIINAICEKRKDAWNTFNKRIFYSYENSDELEFKEATNSVGYPKCIVYLKGGSELHDVKLYPDVHSVNSLIKDESANIKALYAAKNFKAFDAYFSDDMCVLEGPSYNDELDRFLEYYKDAFTKFMQPFARYIYNNALFLEKFNPGGAMSASIERSKIARTYIYNEAITKFSKLKNKNITLTSKTDKEMFTDMNGYDSYTPPAIPQLTDNKYAWVKGFVIKGPRIKSKKWLPIFDVSKTEVVVGATISITKINKNSVTYKVIPDPIAQDDYDYTSAQCAPRRKEFIQASKLAPSYTGSMSIDRMINILAYFSDTFKDNFKQL